MTCLICGHEKLTKKGIRVVYEVIDVELAYALNTENHKEAQTLEGVIRSLGHRALIKERYL